MAALKPIRRNVSAAVLAERLGVSTRTIKNYMAEPRQAYTDRAAARHARIRELREQGLTMRAIAAEVDCTVGTVHYALNKNDA